MDNTSCQHCGHDLNDHAAHAAAVCGCAEGGCRDRTEMRRRHGTPEAFAESVKRAIGEISVSEAMDAIARYEAEYQAAEEQS